MHRANAVVQGDISCHLIGELGLVKIIHFHGSINVDFASIYLSKAIYLVKICLNRFDRHVARRFNGNRTMWGKAEVGYAFGNCLNHKFFHRCMAVTKLCMCVKVVSCSRICYINDVNHDGKEGWLEKFINIVVGYDHHYSVAVRSVVGIWK